MKPARQSLLGSPVRLLRTRAFSGTRVQRQGFRAAQQMVRRAYKLSRMTEPQRAQALKQEAAVKATRAAGQKLAADEKVMRTTAIGGSKEERDEFKSRKAGIIRDRALARMSPEEKGKALKSEADAKAAREQATQKKATARTRRTVAMVGDKEARGSFRQKKQDVRRDAILARMTPAEQQQALDQEKEFQVAESAKAQQEARANEERTVAVVADKPRRDSFGPQQAPRGTPTRMETPGLANSQSALDAELAELQSRLGLAA